MLKHIPSHKINEGNILQALQLLSAAFAEEHRQVQEEITTLKERDLRLIQTVEHLRKDTNRGFAGVHLQIEETNERLDQTNEKLEQTNERLDQTNEKLDDTNKRLGSLEGEVKGLRSDMNRELGTLRSDMNRELGTLRSDMNRELGALRTDMNRALGEQTDLLRMIAANLSSS